jgi:4-diphosphocytidyl-2C-methyl-D-erythritol kinase
VGATGVVCTIEPEVKTELEVEDEIVEDPARLSGSGSVLVSCFPFNAEVLVDGPDGTCPCIGAGA